MIQTTQTWKDYSVDHSNYHPLIVVIKDGNIIWTFDATNIKEGSLRFTDDITDLGDFNIGATPSNSFECDIINFDNTFPSPDTFRGCRANLYFFLERPEFGGSNAVAGQAIVGQAIVGTESTWTDYIKRGVYYLDPVNSVGRTVHISGSDAMSLPEFNSANMTGFSFGGLTCYQAIKKMGFNLQHEFPNSDYVLPNVVCNEESNLANVTKRTALGYIASLCGCYARHDNNGELRLSQFVLDTPIELTKIMQEPNLDYYPVTVTGVFVSGTEGSYSVKGSDGYYLFVENNPLITSPSIADEIATSINTAYNGLVIYPFSLSFIADPSLQAGDTIDITYNGNTTTTIVGSFQYALGNQSTLSMDADTEEHSSAEALIASIPGTKLAIQELYKGDVLKKIINLSADEVQINADQFNINGAVSANGTFSVDTDGYMVATGGTIGGFTIDSDDIHSGMTSLSDTTNDGVYVGTDGIALGKGNFIADASGNVTANSLYSNNATITGGSFKLTTSSSEQDFVQLTYINPANVLQKAIIQAGAFQTVEDYTGGSVNIYWSAHMTGGGLYFYGGSNQSSLKLLLNIGAGGIQGGLIVARNSSGTATIQETGSDGQIVCVGLTQTSDKNAKNDIKDLDEEKSAEFIYSLNPVSFRFNEHNDGTHHGIIAQEVEKSVRNVYGESDWKIVKDPPEDKENNIRYKSLAYNELIADLVATLKSQDKRIKELERRL